MLLDEERDVLDGEALVEDAVGMDHEDRPSFTEPVAAGGDDEDLVAEPPPGDFLLQGVLEREGAAGDASCSGADEQMSPVGWHGYSEGPVRISSSWLALVSVIWP